MSGRANKRRNSKRRVNNNQRNQPVLAVQKQIRDELRQQVIMMAPREPDVNTMHVSKRQTCVLTSVYDSVTVVTGSAAIQQYGLSFSLSQFGNAVGFTSVFDQYRCLQLQAVFLPLVPVQNGAGAIIYTVIDYDDANTITISQADAYASEMIVQAGTYFERTWTPHVADALYSGSAFTAYGNRTSPWIDSGSSNVQHYGLKIIVTSVGSVINLYQLKISAVWQFRSQF